MRVQAAIQLTAANLPWDGGDRARLPRQEDETVTATKKGTRFAAALAVALVAGAGAALAADLDYGRVPSDRYSGAYEDPRYRDLYGPETRYDQRYYRPQHPVPVPPANVYREPDHYRPYPEPRRYSQAEPDDWRYRGGCLPREEIRRRLVEEGWREFHDLELRNGYARVRARRPSGDLYDLKVDRCSGEVVKADVIQRGGYGPYAQDHGPRYYPNPRPYY